MQSKFNIQARRSARKHQQGFAYLGWLIGSLVIVPLALLLWPSVEKTVSFMTVLANTVAMVVQVCLWLVLVYALWRGVRFARKYEIVARLRIAWNKRFNKPDESPGKDGSGEILP